MKVRRVSGRLFGVLALAFATATARGESPREEFWPESRDGEGPSVESRIRATGETDDFLRFFVFEHKRFLYARNGPGSIAWVPSAAKIANGAALPTVVFLHGLNEGEHVYPRMDGGEGDLRPALRALVRAGKVAPFLWLAPTHTRYALGAGSMWPDFDLERFLTRADEALNGRFRTDRSRILLVGHSAGGCNRDGGILSFGATMPSAILAVDSCLGAKTDNALEALALRLPVTFVHERHWKRDTAPFRSFCALLPKCRFVATEEIPDLDLGHDPHAAVLPWALTEELPRWNRPAGYEVLPD